MSSESIRLVNLYFGTGLAPTGTLLENLARELVRRGHHVEVLTGDVGYKGAGRADPKTVGADIRTLGWGSKKAGGIEGRIASWLRFYLACAWFVATHPVPARTVVMTTPPFLHLIFAARNWFARQPSELTLWNQDIYPEVMASVGVIGSGSLTCRLLAFIQRFSTSRVQKVIVLDRAMKTILEAQGAKNIRIIPNWERAPNDVEPVEPIELQQTLEEAKAKFRYLVLYTGNYGWGHDLTILLDYLGRRIDQREFFFLFVGGGARWQSLADFQRRQRLLCLAVFPYVPRKSQVASLLKQADFGLVALKESCVGLLSPSKIYSYLIWGKPLLYIGPEGSNVADAIRDYDCGFGIGEKDLAGLENCLTRIAQNEIDYAKLSENACRAARERYTEPVGERELADFILSS